MKTSGSIVDSLSFVNTWSIIVCDVGVTQVRLSIKEIKALL